ncbi:MAG TPA: HNH endonuclease, partial [Hanamia sp.]|nr:HNH endonuclease [Hanamia sp.]
NGSNGTLYLHREVAKLFNKKTSPKQKYVIHLNHIKTDNRAKNLKWASQAQVNDHQQKSPPKLEYKKVQSNRKKGLKLNAAQVKAIKTLLANPRRKLTHQQIAEKYNVSPMTVYRIKSGENWAGVM